MNARGRVVSAMGTIHKAGCTFARNSLNVKPLSSIPAPKRRTLKKCGHCKP